MAPTPDERWARVRESTAPIHAIWQQEVQELQGKEPRRIYHYTTATGMKGIIEDQVVWASNARYLNDSTELVHASEIIRSTLESKIGTTNCEPVNTFLQRGLSTLGSESIFLGFYDVYVTCFCTNGDLLSQWRSYAGGTGGYALGFDVGYLRTMGASLPPLRKVIYNKSDQERLVSRVIDAYCQLVADLREQHGDNEAMEYVPLLLSPLHDQLSECSFTFKKSAFQEEDEWRIIFVQERRPWLGQKVAKIHFRPTSTSLVPYVCLELIAQAGLYWGALPIAEVIIGPNPHPDLAVRAVEALLNQKHLGYGHTVIQLSQVPLRA